MLNGDIVILYILFVRVIFFVSGLLYFNGFRDEVKDYNF